ncbi:hypothetical protein G9A89_008692 [Geosiphon pyriformis]|nr:hypothetical protein G9A89_008692 [Geosiphon pyriformis]
MADADFAYGETEGPGTTFHEPLSHSIPKLKPLPQVKNCSRCGKKFGIIRTKYHCKNCGNVTCSRCSDNRADLSKFGLFRPERVCDLCSQVLNISKMGRSELMSLPTKTLREYIEAFDLPSKNVLEKEDLVSIIVSHKPMPERNEKFFRENMPIAEPTTSPENNGSTGSQSAENANRSTNNDHTRGSSARPYDSNSNQRRANNNNNNNNNNNTQERDQQRNNRETSYPGNQSAQHQNQNNQSSSLPLFNSQIFENVIDQIIGQFSSQSSSSRESNGSRNTQQDTNPPSPPIPTQRYNSTQNAPNSIPPIRPQRYNSTQNAPNSIPPIRPQRYNSTQNSQNSSRPSQIHSNSFSPNQNRPRSNPTPSQPQTSSQIPVNNDSNNSNIQNKIDISHSLEDIAKSQVDISKLSNKILKQILKENCVDFSGIVEKSELVQKVNRLVDATKSEMSANLSSLGDDALCKICCDAVQNCVILDCGHMSTCMDCGKKLQEARNECPICRETIIKLIRVYRA